MKKLILACGLSLICTSLFAQSNSATVIVKNIEGFSESGDAFSFKPPQANAIKFITQVVAIRFRVKSWFLIPSKLRKPFAYV